MEANSNFMNMGVDNESPFLTSDTWMGETDPTLPFFEENEIMDLLDEIGFDYDTFLAENPLVQAGIESGEIETGINSHIPPMIPDQTLENQIQENGGENEAAINSHIPPMIPDQTWENQIQDNGGEIEAAINSHIPPMIPDQTLENQIQGNGGEIDIVEAALAAADLDFTNFMDEPDYTLSIFDEAAVPISNTETLPTVDEAVPISNTMAETSAKKNIVPDEQKDEAYWRKRERNREALRRYRAKKKEKRNGTAESLINFEQLEEKLAGLEKQNAKLEKTYRRKVKKGTKLQEKYDAIYTIIMESMD